MATGREAVAASTSDRPNQPSPDLAAARAAVSGRLAPSGIALLITLTFTWGLNWPMMKLALLEVPPWTFRTLCLLVGGTVLLGLARLGGGSAALPAGRLPLLVFVSLFNITGWHLFSAYGLINTGSGRAAIVAYTMPLWASLLSVFVLRARLTFAQILALGLGMGAMFLLLAEDLEVLGAAPLGTLLMLGAAVSWAIGTVLIKKFDWGQLPVTALTGWQQLLGGMPILIGWWMLEPWPDLLGLSLPSAIGLAYAVFVAMIFCHTAYFKLVSLLPAHVAAISVLAVPVVGVVSSALILAEPVGLPEAGALLLVVSGLFLLVRSARP